jgi:hypothetical protein
VKNAITGGLAIFIRKNNMKNILQKHNEVAPGIFVFDNVIENSKNIIDIALSSNGWRDSMVSSPYANFKEIINKDYRNNKILDIYYGPKYPKEWKRVSKLIWSYGDYYAKKFDIGFSCMETVQLLHYRNKNNFYKPHFDDGATTSRIFSALLYLNEVEEGGETRFVHFNVSINPKPGRLVIFPANFIYLHEAKPPKLGEKFVFVTWFTK